MPAATNGTLNRAPAARPPPVPQANGRRVYLLVGSHPHKRSNAAALMGIYCVLHLGWTPVSLGAAQLGEGQGTAAVSAAQETSEHAPAGAPQLEDTCAACAAAPAFQCINWAH